MFIYFFNVKTHAIFYKMCLLRAAASAVLGGGMVVAAQLLVHSFDHVDYEIAHLLGLTHDIHVEDTCLIGIFLLVDVLDVLGTQQVATY